MFGNVMLSLLKPTRFVKGLYEPSNAIGSGCVVRMDSGLCMAGTVDASGMWHVQCELPSEQTEHELMQLLYV
jgi:hypothetical protein